DLLLSLAALLACLPPAELAMRLALHRPTLRTARPFFRDAPVLGYEPLPNNIVREDRDGVFEAEYRLNSLGTRGPEPVPAAHGGLTTLALGCSLTFGTGAAEGEPWPDALGRRLGEGSVVLNGAVP